MRWRDVRFEKPTASDSDDGMQILQLLEDGSIMTHDYDSLVGMVAWMPLLEWLSFFASHCDGGKTQGLASQCQGDSICRT